MPRVGSQLMIRSLFTRRPSSPPSIPAGQRIYAVGDVHGRLDLLRTLLASIRTDSEARGRLDIEIILLGDLIDRGPASAGVVALAMASPDWARITAIQGNHESVMLAALDGDRNMCRLWLRNGGTAALASWGVEERVLSDGTLEEVIAAAVDTVPPEQRRFLASLPLSRHIGDYYFVHAGVRPGVPLQEQVSSDSLWIRGGFLESSADHGAVIVHGHSVAADVDHRPNRIGIDTGAYASGRLTALGLEGTEHWLIQTDVAEGAYP